MTYCPYCMTAFSEGRACPACGHLPESYASTSWQLSAGTILVGRYLLGCVLGEGGFGITYLAFDLKEGRKVGIKEHFPRDKVRRMDMGATVLDTHMGSDPDASGGNSVMPYIWNDDLQDVEANPNYHPEGGAVASGGEASAVASEGSDGKGIPGKKDRDYDSILAGCRSFSEAVTGVRRTAMLLEKEISAAESVLTDSVSRKNMASLRGMADLIGKASAMAAARIQDLEKHVSQDKARFEELL